jgi:hypothetical protein
MMPIHVEWLIPQRVIISHLSGVIRLQDVETLLAQQQKFVAEGTPLVHHISDGLQIKSIEIRLKTFQLLMKGVPMSEKFGWHIDVTNNPVTRMTSTLVSQFLPVRVRSYATIKEAVRFLQEVDPSLQEAEIR